MSESISSLNVPSVRLQEGLRPSQRSRQGGTGSSEVKNPNAGQTARAEPMDIEQAKGLAQKLNQALSQIDGNFSVSVDDATGMMVVRITDTDTGEIVKQVPPQRILDANVSMEKIIGLLVNDQA